MEGEGVCDVLPTVEGESLGLGVCLCVCVCDASRWRLRFHSKHLGETSPTLYGVVVTERRVGQDHILPWWTSCHRDESSFGEIRAGGGKSISSPLSLCPSSLLTRCAHGLDDN